MSARPLVSIVMPLYNQAKFVGASIASCLAQTYPGVEVIVVNDRSTDGSDEIARRYAPAVRVIDMPRNGGSCLARNLGLSRARGEFVMFHDSDDLLFPDRLWHDVRVLTGPPGADAVFSINRWFQDGRRLSCDPRPLYRRERKVRRRLSEVSGSIERGLMSILTYGGPQQSCLVYRTDVAKRVGGYEDGTEPFSDRELLFRALCHRATVALNARVTCGWRMYQSTQRMTSQLKDDEPQRRLMLARRYHTLLHDAGLLEREPLRRALIAHVAGRVYEYARRCQRHDIAGAALTFVAQLTASTHGMSSCRH